MKTADEMFKELDYKKYDNHPEEDYPPEPNTWTTQDERVIEYTQTGEVNGMPAREVIKFYPMRKNVIVSAVVGIRPTIVPLSIEEIQAIYKKCEELRYLD